MLLTGATPPLTPLTLHILASTAAVSLAAVDKLASLCKARPQQLLHADVLQVSACIRGAQIAGGHSICLHGPFPIAASSVAIHQSPQVSFMRSANLNPPACRHNNLCTAVLPHVVSTAQQTYTVFVPAM